MIKKILLLSGFLLYLPTADAQTVSHATNKGLSNIYIDFFPIGVAVSPASLQPGDEASLIKKHFASITAENVMKPQPIHPEENKYNWAPADKIMEFALANRMKVRGHTLCWHNQTPNWFFKDADGNAAGKELVLQRLKTHIETVVGRYKGKIYAWDVVNEAIADAAGESIYRETNWYKLAGKEYIAKAFEYAHAADPDAVLFYNDYNTISPGKRERIYTLIKDLLDQGVPIHGVGLQGHWSINTPIAEELENTIRKFASLGLTVQITELDISIHDKGEPSRELLPKDTTKFSPEIAQRQADQYGLIFDILRRNQKYISGVTFWNISDQHSWLDNFPVKGRKDYPLLFDQYLQPKKAYWRVVDFK